MANNEKTPAQIAEDTSTQKGVSAPEAKQETVTLESSGTRPADISIGGDKAISANKPINRTILPERRDAEVKRNVELSMKDYDNKNVQRLAQIAGTSINGLRLFHENDVAHGNLILLNVDDQEQIELRPDAKVPAGTWVSVRQLPEEFLASVR